MFPRTCLAMALLLATTAAHADDDSWNASGDLRFGYLASETRSRGGASSDTDSVRARARLRLQGALGGGWHAGGRVAARFDSRQDGTEVWLRSWAPGPAGLEDGQATIDEAWLEYRSAASPWRLRLGRFQAAFALDDIMKKSLDQNDSSSFDITWTDGVWWQWQGEAWTTHAILRHNDRRGPTGTLRPPLDFADSGARTGLFLATESRAQAGPVVQRMLTLTWLPSALRPDGPAGAATRDYFAVTAKGVADWPLGAGERRFRLGGELGYAPETPRREAMDSGTGEAGGWSWQASFNLMDVLPDHDVGLVYGRVADGWLLSSDFRPNEKMLEARWVWQATPDWQFDVRLRRREEVDLPAAAAHARRDDDLYARATFRF